MKKTYRVYLVAMAAVLMVLLSMTASASSIRCKYYQEHGDHEWKQIQNIATTCTKDGYYIYKCATCSTTKKEVYEKAWQHDWQESENVPATCTTAGYHQIKCSKCGVSKKETTDKALGHNWQQTGEVAATCTVKGYTQHTCATCGETKQETIKAVGHDWEKTGGVEPDCTTDGCITYRCTNSHLGCSETKQTVIPAVGHDPKDVRVLKTATCLETGFVQTLCRTCGATDVKETPVADHVYDMWRISRAATDSEMGVRSRSCTVCRYTQEESYYPDGTMMRKVGVGEGVIELQSMLKECGYLNDRIDGEFGRNTEQAVKDFQTKAGIRVDGIAWPQTVKLLKAEWEQKMGITPTPTRTSPRTSVPSITSQPPQQDVLHCTYVTNEYGNGEIIYCQAHQAMLDSDARMLAAANTEAEKMNALRQTRTRWESELAWLYEEWLSSASEAEKTAVNNANAAFSVYVASQELIWSRQYAQSPEIVIEKVNALLIAQAVDLCSIINAPQSAAVTTQNGYVSVELIDDWYTGSAKGSTALILYRDDMGNGKSGRLTISDEKTDRSLYQEKQAVVLQHFQGKQFMDIMIGENIFAYVCSTDSMNFVLLAEAADGQVVKIESSGCTIAQAMPLLKTIVIR